MLSNFLHTNKCTKCGKQYQTKEYIEKDICDSCGGAVEYIGLQQQKNTLMEMLEEIQKGFDQTENVSKTFDNGITAMEITEQEANSIIEKTKPIEEEATKEELTQDDNQTEQEVKTIEQENENIEQENVSIIQKEQSIGLTIDDLLDTNSKISNAQMIPALKLAIAENSLQKINLLKDHYQNIYESSLKYIGKKNLTKLNELVK